MITKKQIENLARLSKIKFLDKDIENFEKDFESIVKFVSQVENVQVSDNYTPNFQDFDSLRDDIVSDSYDRGELLKNAYDFDEEYFKTPKVVE